MSKSKRLTKQERISDEEVRLRQFFSSIPSDAQGVADGLIREAAYMRVQLEEYRRDLDDKGYVEMFTQSEKMAPYERERPVARLYNALNKNYQSILKQLSDLLPKPKAGGKPGERDDGFDRFVDNKQA